MHNKIQLLVIFIFSLTTLAAQETRTLKLTLAETIELAQSDAPESLIAKTQLTNNYWEFQSFKADYKPQVMLSTNIPSLNRSIFPVTQPDGTLKFVSQSQLRNSFDVSVEQRITSTGGVVFASTGLERIDLFGDNGGVSYFSTPINFGIRQPLFGFNSFKWDKKIEPLRFLEAKRSYSEDVEAVATQAAALFFDVFIAQLNMNASQQDIANADTLLTIARGRYSVGKIAETDLLQVEISKMNIDADLARSTLNFQSSTENLRNFLGIQDAIKFDLIPPTDIPTFTIDAVKALEMAKQNRSETVQFERQLLQAKQGIERAKGQNGITANLYGSFGLSQTGNTLPKAYQSPLDQEILTLNLSLPIKDWGKAKSERKIAESEAKLIQMQVTQDRINFERNISLKVRQFDLVRKQVKLALKTYEVSQKNFDITKKRYLIGKIGVTELNLAIAQQARNRQAYFATLRSFWLAYYEIRRLTLYDFMEDKSLQRNLKVGD